MVTSVTDIVISVIMMSCLYGNYFSIMAEIVP